MPSSVSYLVPVSSPRTWFPVSSKEQQVFSMINCERAVCIPYIVDSMRCPGKGQVELLMFCERWHGFVSGLQEDLSDGRNATTTTSQNVYSDFQVLYTINIDMRLYVSFGERYMK